MWLVNSAKRKGGKKISGFSRYQTTEAASFLKNEDQLFFQSYSSVNRKQNEAEEEEEEEKTFFFGACPFHCVHCCLLRHYINFQLVFFSAPQSTQLAKGRATYKEKRVFSLRIH